MYYKSLLETLKDEGDNRIRVEDEFKNSIESGKKLNSTGLQNLLSFYFQSRFLLF